MTFLKWFSLDHRVHNRKKTQQRHQQMATGEDIMLKQMRIALPLQNVREPIHKKCLIALIAGVCLFFTCE